MKYIALITIFFASHLSFCDLLSLQKQIDVFVVGDSIVAGLPMGIEKSWVTLLKNEVKEISIHTSIYQKTVTTDAAIEVLAEVLALKPKYFIICLGINDFGRGFPIEHTYNNLKYVIKECEKNDIIIILGYNDLSAYSEEYRFKTFKNVYINLYMEFRKVIKFDYITPSISTNPSLHIGDRFHPNEMGQIILKDRIKLILFRELNLL